MSTTIMSATRRDLLRGLGAGAVALSAAGTAGQAQPAATGAGAKLTIIDVHGHYTTVPKAMRDFRDLQIAAVKDPSKAPPKSMLNFSDDEVRASVQQQLKLQTERGTNVTIFSPIAGAMGHHLGNEATSIEWSQAFNDLIHRVCKLYPDNFIGVGQLPQSPGVSPKNCAAELDRMVKQLGFVGCNINPDPSGGYWRDPPMTDRWWYPLYEKLVELDVPAMIHASSSANPNFHGTGSHYLNANTAVFMQLVTADLFKDFPTLRFVIPHGGGAIPYHWSRYRGLAQDMKRPPLTELLKNVYFDTCVYYRPGLELLLKTVPIDNILFASEVIGAVRGVDPETGHGYDDTKRMIDTFTWLSEADRRKLFQDNARRVYRLKI
jgi:4-oxalmesaconate hydratase